jgi:hypothetical protein
MDGHEDAKGVAWLLRCGVMETLRRPNQRDSVLGAGENNRRPPAATGA